MNNTVKDLIERLSVLPPDGIVVLEGCDCEGEWNGAIEVKDWDHIVPSPNSKEYDAKFVLLKRGHEI